MSTYAEKNSEWIYNWQQIIVDIMNGEYNHEQLEEVRDAAGNWVTCGCGNQCDLIPRDLDGCPFGGDHLPAHIKGTIDYLANRGGRFLDDINDLINEPCAHRAADAMGTLAEIEFLSSIIIQELINSKKTGKSKKKRG